jgi:hypothetical protein
MIEISEVRSLAEVRAHYAAVSQRLWHPRRRGFDPEAPPPPIRSPRRRGPRIVAPPPTPALADYLAKTATYDVCAETAAERAQRYGAVPALLILRAVCAAYGVTPLELQSRRRTVAIIAPRHEAAWLLRRFTSLSLPQIGAVLGKRDHTTILHAVTRFEERLRAGAVAARALAQVEAIALTAARRAGDVA